MSISSLKEIIDYLCIVLLFVNTILFIKSYITTDNVAFKYFGIYLLICFLTSTSSFLLHYYKINNLYLSHIYFITQFVLLSCFYKKMFKKIQIRIVNVVMVFVLITLCIQYTLNPELFSKFNNLEIFITSFPIVIYSVIHLFNSLTQNNRFMLINSGILIYLTLSTLIFILGDYLSSVINSSVVKIIWFINTVLYAIYLILILIEWKMSTKRVQNK